MLPYEFIALIELAIEFGITTVFGATTVLVVIASLMGLGIIKILRCLYLENSVKIYKV